jgi:phage-related protein (TIGR01555 family)
MRHLDMIREFQTIEGMTLMDGSDKFETHSYSFAGVADVLLRFAEQVSGATGIPLVRLFGQSPAGFNTGDGDLENYYSRVNSLQERRLRRHVRKLLDISWRSCSASHCQTTSPSSLTSSGRCPTLTAQRWLTTSQRRSLLW